MDLLPDMATDAKRLMRPNTFGVPFFSCIYPELFCFALILKFGDSRILGLGGSTVKACRALLHFVKTVLLHLC